VGGSRREPRRHTCTVATWHSATQAGTSLGTSKGMRKQASLRLNSTAALHNLSKVPPTTRFRKFKKLEWPSPLRESSSATSLKKRAVQSHGRLQSLQTGLSPPGPLQPKRAGTGAESCTAMSSARPCAEMPCLVSSSPALPSCSRGSIVDSQSYKRRTPVTPLLRVCSTQLALSSSGRGGVTSTE